MPVVKIGNDSIGEIENGDQCTDAAVFCVAASIPYPLSMLHRTRIETGRDYLMEDTSTGNSVFRRN